MNSKSGALYIVATPIGNLADMTVRAIETLREVDLILAEDTRHAAVLLSHYEIDRPLWSCHEHNERKQLPAIMQRLQNGEQVALISDAGTPLISDPGYPLVNEARAQGVTVVPIPGACAVIAALCASGLPTDRFCFEGFVPSKAGARKRFLEALENEARTIVMYESSHRIVDCLTEIAATLGGGRRVVIGRELTKKFEQFYSGSASELAQQIEEGQHDERGEFVVIVEGGRDQDAAQADAVRLLGLLLDEMPLKAACKIAAAFTGANRNGLYQLGLEMRGGA